MDVLAFSQSNSILSPQERVLSLAIGFFQMILNDDNSNDIYDLRFNPLEGRERRAGNWGKYCKSDPSSITYRLSTLLEFEKTPPQD